jgi:hypothetical protein
MCQLQARAYTLAWTRPNMQPLPTNARDDFGGVLTIENVRDDNAGDYR